MPLIVITGVPSSGKTTRADQLEEYFKSQGYETHIISENLEIANNSYEKNLFYLGIISLRFWQREADQKFSEIGSITPHHHQKYSHPGFLNYIKGYRYELFCGTKANKVPQCTLSTMINRDQAWEWNQKREDEQKYDRQTFDALLLRYEEPNSKDRWDSPLFAVFPDDKLDTEAIKTALFHGKQVKPNMSTQNPPLSSTNFLYDLDQITKKIVDNCTSCARIGAQFTYKLQNGNIVTLDILNVTTQQLMLLRRQYITYAKMHPPDVKDIENLFLQYLTASIK